MKIKHLFFFILMSLFVISCDRDEKINVIDNTENLVTKIKTGYFFTGLSIANQSDVVFNFEYDNQKRVSKKIGGFLPISGATGYNGFFTNQLYTLLTYNANKITVEDFSSSSEFTTPKKSKYFTLNAQNQIEIKEIPDANHYLSKRLQFIYKNGNLDEIKTTYPNLPYDPTDPTDFLWTQSEKFFYDSAGNLIRTEFYNQNDGINTNDKIIKLFENFDSSINPFKKFMLLDEYFYRSLSKNNFRTYKEVNYQYGTSSTSQKDWIFNYDSNGNIIID